ncbi:2,4-dichlorophenol 6-monooxygenase [Siccirubricoccus deserti]|uniref:FAD-dependent monooxygenase n=1 Tax=Siccirubricoccus deserti TaxID=2013562 RepID=A0A9X0UF57_9PROT|nr:FAD-dependent monooxygenase [Siccirubricoccus deserti]MBC4018402.1 FAD-dependent monooxygenase [Siccirubricoccus deserti]GGC65576.1 2,4-dichlorophenol 6-monooxygenase [Siccirubricoccus deserti]
MIETDVLIVGSGPAGGSAALMLSSQGVRNILVTKHHWLADSPRAHITNQRTMEILRDLGVEQEAVALATSQDLMGNTVFCTSLAGEELGRVRAWGTRPDRRAEHAMASPSAICDLPQNLLEPLLIGNAAARGTRLRFDIEYLSLEQDAHGVTARVRDRLDGTEYPIRAKYLIGADGGRSKVAEDIGLPFEGQMGIAGSMNIVFEADLSRYVAHRPSVLYWVLQPGSSIGGIGMGVVRMIRPWTEWMAIWGYDINGPAPQVDAEEATRIVHRLIGDATVPVRIRSTALWTVNRMYATRYSKGRVFCMGDAVHRHPPSNGLGSNTSIQDAYNLCWKLAMVLKGQADPSLLDSYDAERVPIGRQVVERANRSIEEFGPIFGALGLLGTQDAEVMGANMEARKAATPEAAAQRDQLRQAILAKQYEFDAHGVEMNQRYRSSAVASDASPEPEWRRDPELHYEPTTWPGARLPHAWLVQRGCQVSTLDLAGKGRFALLTGIGGEAWVDAARAAAERLGIAINAFLVGPGRDLEDPFGEWCVAREVGEAGCVLVRPDMHIAWRAQDAAQVARLADVLACLLGRDGGTLMLAAE